MDESLLDEMTLDVDDVPSDESRIEDDRTHYGPSISNGPFKKPQPIGMVDRRDSLSQCPSFILKIRTKGHHEIRAFMKQAMKEIQTQERVSLLDPERKEGVPSKD